MRVTRVERFDDVELDVIEAGAGGRPLLLMHGFTGAKEDFQDSFPAFAEAGFHVVAADHRGHGSSTHSDTTPYSLEQFATDQVRLIERLGWQRCAILGHSMGGVVAQLLTLERPYMVERLILMDTFGAGLPGMDAEIVALGAEIARTQGLEPIADILAAWEADQGTTPPAQARLAAERPGYDAWNREKFLRCSPRMWADLVMGMLEAPDRHARLGELEMPVLVIVGEQDERFLEPARLLAESLPTARLVVIPEAAHSPQLEAPERWWDEVSAFLND